MKLKVKWTPDIKQDIDALTTPTSFVYNKKITEKIIKQFGSVDNFKNIMSKK
jgi:superoxide dismutase